MEPLTGVIGTNERVLREVPQNINWRSVLIFFLIRLLDPYELFGDLTPLYASP